MFMVVVVIACLEDIANETELIQNDRRHKHTATHKHPFNNFVIFI